MRSLLVRYAFTVRGVVLSSWGRRRQAELLAALTGPAWTLYFGSRRWNPWMWVAAARAREELVAQLEAIEGTGSDNE